MCHSTIFVRGREGIFVEAVKLLVLTLDGQILVRVSMVFLPDVTKRWFSLLYQSILNPTVA